MERVYTLNPFAKREFRDQRSLLTNKILTILSWLLVVVVSIHYHYGIPGDGRYVGKTIWEQSKAHPTPFSLNPTVVDFYWIILFVLQLCYVCHVFASEQDLVIAALNVGFHFVVNNVLQSAFIMLWVRSQFWIAELVLIINAFNLKALYLRCSTTPSFIHVPVVSGPWAWTFIALFWNGAVAIDAQNFAARIVANVAILSFLLFGLSYLAVYGDYTVGFAICFLSIGLGLQQFRLHAFGLQWIFAFVIAALLFSATVPLALPFLLRRDMSLRPYSHNFIEDPERQPLLDDE